MTSFKNHFIQLFAYDRYANIQILKLLAVVAASNRPVSLLSHLLGSQQVWLNRCRKDQLSVMPIWPIYAAEELEPIMEDNYHQWLNFLQVCKENDFSLPITYQNSKGETFHEELSDIIMHVINHGTHHRAQVGQLCKLEGVEALPPTDYIAYIRENKS
ncbi:MAG: DinB family protein [Sphingobacteriaceae bacterium]